jgi:hypothetical protein
MKIGPFEEGQEYEVKYWIASQLEKTGIATSKKENSLTSRK